MKEEEKDKENDMWVEVTELAKVVEDVEAVGVEEEKEQEDDDA